MEKQLQVWAHLAWGHFELHDLRAFTKTRNGTEWNGTERSGMKMEPYGTEH